MLTCDFKLCVYQDGGQCILESIDINEYGMCDNAIVFDLPDERIDCEKKRQLWIMEKRAAHGPKLTAP
jgi:hypothetical protein